MWNTTDARSHSTCQQAWTSLNHRKNVLSCVYRSYHLPFRAHRNAWKTTIVPQCLVNLSKYTSRRNSSIRETCSMFFNRSSRITIAKTIYKMHVTIFHVRKYERHISISVHYQSLRNHSGYWTPWRNCISRERHQHAAPRACLRVDKSRSWQRSLLDAKEVHNFQLPLSPKPLNSGYRCFWVISV